jgi:hypothetical protein
MEENSFFHFKNGRFARNIWDLRRELEVISDAEYNEHANSQKNDFANWIEHSVGDKMLAEKLRKAGNKNDAVLMLKGKISEISGEIGKSHIVSDFDLIKDFLLGLLIGLVIGMAIGIFLL